MIKNPYIPEMVRIIKINKETPDTKTIVLDKKIFTSPGQFVEVSILRYGEAPISVASHRSENLTLTIRSAGDMTRAIHRLHVGDYIGIRGPFGKGWPIDKVQGQSLLLICGGIGLAPIRPVIKEIEKGKGKFKDVILLYGAREPQLLLYKKELEKWAEFIEVHTIVDYCKGRSVTPTRVWKGDVGVVTELFNKIKIPEMVSSFICGPPVMMKFSILGLLKKEIPMNKIFLSLERHMKCGMGICGRCQVGGHYVCKDGPIFSVNEMISWLERPEEMEGVV